MLDTIIKKMLKKAHFYSRWMAYSRKHMEYTFSYELLLQLLESLDLKWTPDSLSREEVILAHVQYFNNHKKMKAFLAD